MARPDPRRLREAASAVPDEGLQLNQLLALAPGGGLPAMIVMCTLPAALPGLQLGWIAVPVLLYLSRALWLGQSQLVLPGRIGSTRISRKSARAILNTFAWVVEKFGRYGRTTCPQLVRRTRRKPAALLVAAMSLVILLPLPGSNFVPAVAIVTLMGGLVWRDGRAIVAAFVLSVLGVLIVAGISWAAWAALVSWF